MSSLYTEWYIMVVFSFQEEKPAEVEEKTEVDEKEEERKRREVCAI